VLARSAEILFGFFIFLFIILTIALLPQIEFQQIQPIFETGIKPMINAVFLFTSIFSLPLIVLLMIFPVSVNQSKNAEKNFFVGVLIGGVFLIIIIMLSILVLGADASSRHIYPSYALARKINIGNFFQRVEAILALIWFITIYFKMTLYFYTCVISLAQTLNMKDYQPLTLPLGMIMVCFSLIAHPNIVEIGTFMKEIWPLYILMYGLFLPLLLLAVNAITKK
jgi:spore germination protein KB